MTNQTRSEEVLTRQQLYDLVWSEPITTIVTRFGISNVAFAKACKRHEIPVPPRGYWAKVQSGHKAQKQPLPERGLGMPEIIRFGSGPYHWAYAGLPANLTEMEIAPPPAFVETLPELTERVRALVGKMTLPKTLNNAHPAIAKLLAADNARRQKQLSSPYPWSYDEPLFESPFERRRLRLLNAIFMALQKLGFSASLAGKDPQDFTARVGLENVSFKLDHPKQERHGYRPSSDKNRPASDILRIEISNWQKPSGIQLAWQDDKEDLVETHLADILVSLIVAAEMQYRNGEQRHYEWLVERKADLIEEARKRKEEEERQERERQAKLAKARVDRLLGEAAAFRQASDIRAYVETVRKANVASDNPVSADDFETWASWARVQADRIDPVLSRAFLKPMDES